MAWLTGQDLRYATRSLRAARGFAAVAILTLGLGIGATTAIFSLVNGLVLRDLGVPNLDRLVVLTTATGPGGVPAGGLTLDQLRAVREAGIPGVQTVFVSDPLIAAMSVPARSQVLQGELVTAGYFAALDLRPIAGRVLGDADDRAAETGGPIAAVISERVWRQWFGASPTAVGTVVRITGEPVTIVGVLSDAFPGTWLPAILHNDLWVPAAARSRLRSVQGTAPPSVVPRSRTFLRLSDDALQPAATAAIASVVRGLNPDRAEQNVTTVPGRSGVLFEAYVGPGLLIGTGVTTLALLVFLIACSNLTNLLLARGSYRQGELAIRLATGASRGRIFRLVFAEAVVLTAASAIVGLAIAVGLSRLLMAVPIPELDSIRVTFDASPDWRVFTFGLGAALVATLAVGLLPAWRATRVEPWRVLAAGGVGGATRHRRRAQTVLVMAQVGMSVVLLLVAGLYLRSAWKAETFDPGYAGGHAAMASLDFRLHRIDEDRGRRLQHDLLEAARSIPGVTAAALAPGVPDGQGTDYTAQLLPEGAPPVDPGRRSLDRLARFLRVSPDFFRTIGLPVLQGREFTQADVERGLPVAIVSDRTAEQFWPGRDPIGQRIRIDRDGPLYDVVGVVATVVRAQGNATGLFFYLPFGTDYRPGFSIFVSGAGLTAQRLLGPLQGAIRSVDSELAVSNVQPASEAGIGPWRALVQISALVLGSLGLLGLAISMLGVFGITSYTVSQRLREFGVRKALGATDADLYRVILGATLRVLLSGVVPGVVVAYIVAGSVRLLVYGIEQQDPVTFLAVPVLLIAVGLLAAAVAARRAARVEPTAALRQE